MKLQNAPHVRDARGRLAYRHDQSDVDTEDQQLGRVLHAFTGRDPHDESVLMSDSDDGRLVRMDLAPKDVSTPHIAFGVYGDDDVVEWVAELAAPVRKVGVMNGYLMQLTTSADIVRQVLPLATQGSAPARVNPTLLKPAYNCLDIGIDVSVPEEVRANADQDLNIALGNFARVVWKLYLENKVATLLTTSTSWNAANVFNRSGAKWSSSGNPISDIYSILNVSRVRPNLLVLGDKASQYFFNNSNVQQFVQAGGLAAIGLQVVSCPAKLTSSGSLSDVWGNNAVLVRTGGPGQLTTAACARWRQSNLNTPRGERWVVTPDEVLLRCFWNPSIGGRGFDSAILAAANDCVMLEPQVGGLLQNVV